MAVAIPPVSEHMEQVPILVLGADMPTDGPCQSSNTFSFLLWFFWWEGRRIERPTTASVSNLSGKEAMLIPFGHRRHDGNVLKLSCYPNLRKREKHYCKPFSFAKPARHVTYYGLCTSLSNGNFKCFGSNHFQVCTFDHNFASLRISQSAL